MMNGEYVFIADSVIGGVNIMPVCLLYTSNGEEWFPPLLGISIISTVRKVFKSIRPILGVLLALPKAHLPSCIPSVTDKAG